MNPSQSNGIISILIADDSPMIRIGVKTYFQDDKHIKIIAEAKNSLELLCLLKNIQPPNVVLLDAEIPSKENSIGALTTIKKLYPTVTVIMLLEYEDLVFISRAMEIGANSCLDKKDCCHDTLSHAIIEVCNKDYHFNDLVNRALFEKVHKNTNVNQTPPFIKLDEREKTILKLMCQEKSTKEIAGIVGLRPKTIESIRDKMKPKTGTNSMVGLILFAVKTKLYEIPA